jgi:hypothetical protein
VLTLIGLVWLQTHPITNQWVQGKKGYGPLSLARAGRPSCIAIGAKRVEDWWVWVRTQLSPHRISSKRHLGS